MIKTHYLLLLAVLFAVSCSSSDDLSPQSPNAPTHFKGQWINKQISLSWQAPQSSDDLQYEIYLQDFEEFELVFVTRDTECKLDEHFTGRNVFKIRAQSVINKELCSNFSEELFVQVEYTKNQKEIQALYNISLQNPDSKLQWEFDFDPANPTKPIGIRNYDKLITFSNIEREQRVTNLHISDYQLTTLASADLSALSEIRTLDCNKNSLTTLDLRGNKNLTSLYCFRNQLIALDLSANKNLVSLDCDNNQLTTLNLSTNTNLDLLFCDNNKLKSLDLSNSKELDILTCDNNQLTSLDISASTKLRAVLCSDNQLPSLNLSNNPLLHSVDCSNNPFADGKVRILQSFVDRLKDADPEKETKLYPAISSSIYQIVSK